MERSEKQICNWESVGLRIIGTPNEPAGLHQGGIYLEGETAIIIVTDIEAFKQQIEKTFLLSGAKLTVVPVDEEKTS